MTLDAVRSRYRRTEAWFEERPFYRDLAHAVGVGVGWMVGGAVAGQSLAVVLVGAIVAVLVAGGLLGLLRLVRGAGR